MIVFQRFQIGTSVAVRANCFLPVVARNSLDRGRTLTLYGDAPLPLLAAELEPLHAVYFIFGACRGAGLMRRPQAKGQATGKTREWLQR